MLRALQTGFVCQLAKIQDLLAYMLLTELEGQRKLNQQRINCPAGSSNYFSFNLLDQMSKLRWE